MKKILNVPFNKQVLSFSCFPASVRMVLKYFGDNINEKTLAINSRLPDHKGCWDVKIAPFLIKKGYNVISYWNGLLSGWNASKKLAKAYNAEYKKASKIGFRHKKNARISTIKDYIKNGIPVLTEVDASMFYKKKFDFTHMIVVVGYDKVNFFVHDPDKDWGKTFKKISISKFRKAWEKLSPKSGRSMFVVFPKANST